MLIMASYYECGTQKSISRNCKTEADVIGFMDSLKSLRQKGFVHELEFYRQDKHTGKLLPLEQYNKRNGMGDSNQVNFVGKFTPKTSNYYTTLARKFHNI